MEKIIDPVCGMEVDPASSEGESEYGGQRYYFCAQACKDQFDAAPDRFIQNNGILERERGGI